MHVSVSRRALALMGAIMLAPALAGGAAVAAPYPVAWWPLDDGASPTTELVRGLVGALSGNAAAGPAWVIEDLGGDVTALAPIDCNRDALRFDGSDDFVSVADTTEGALDGFGALTLSAWIRPSGPSSSDGGIVVSKYDTHNAWASWALMRMPGAGGQMRLFVGQQKSPVETFIYADSTSASAPAGVWTHVVGVWTGDTNPVTGLRIYLNGVSVPVTGASAGTFTHMYRGAVPIEIGSLHSATGGFVGRTAFFAGDIDDVRVYDVALSDAEVAALAAGHDALGACSMCPIDCSLDTQRVFYGVVRRARDGALGSIQCWKTSAGVVDCRRDHEGALLVGPPECSP